MVKSIGIDIVEVERITKDIKRYGDRFVKRILGPGELSLYEKRYDKEQFISGRFAAKEAVIKALGQYLKDKPPFNEIQILNDNTGQPKLHISKEITKKIGQAICLISITHEKKYAAAVAVFTEEK